MASITKLSNGKYRVQLHLANKRKSRTFKTENQAQQWAYQEEHFHLQNKIETSENVDTLTGHDLFKRYKVEVCPTKSRGGNWEKTKINRWLLLSDFAEPITDDLERYKKIIRSYAERRMREGKTGNTVCRELSLISAIFNYGIKHWDIGLKDNPVRLVPRPKMNCKPRKERWSDEQIQKIYAAANFAYGDTPKLLQHKICYALSLSVETAMRLGEICSLRKKDYRFELSENGKQFYVYLEKTKNGDERYVPLSTKAKSIMDILVANLKDNEYVLGGSSPDNASSLFRKLKKKAGFEEKHFHDARHEAITRLAKIIPNVVVLSAISGHKELRVLKRYYNPTVTESGSYLS